MVVGDVKFAQPYCLRPEFVGHDDHQVGITFGMQVLVRNLFSKGSGKEQAVVGGHKPAQGVGGKFKTQLTACRGSIHDACIQRISDLPYFGVCGNATHGKGCHETLACSCRVGKRHLSAGKDQPPVHVYLHIAKPTHG